MRIQSIGFTNTLYKPEWLPGYKEAHASRQYGIIPWTVYDGKTNFMGTVNAQTGEIVYAGTPTEYKRTFLVCALNAVKKLG